MLSKTLILFIFYTGLIYNLSAAANVPCPPGYKQCSTTRYMATSYYETTCVVTYTYPCPTWWNRYKTCTGYKEETCIRANGGYYYRTYYCCADLPDVPIGDDRL